MAHGSAGRAEDVSARRRLGGFSLLMCGLSSIIGAGWLFGSVKAASVAGPAAILAWGIGGVITLLIGLSYMELGSTFPKSGGAVRYAQYSHGSLAGFLGGWTNWIAISAIVPIEAEASVQYMSSWPWDWARAMVDGKELHTSGIAVAALLIFVYFFINYWTVRFFAVANSVVTMVKIIVPLLTVVGLLATGFDGDNFTSHGGFAPNGWPAVLTAIATSGVMFAFNGFQSPINMAGEARRPQRSVPFALIGGILFAAVLYVGLQVAFIGSVPGNSLGNGWGGIDFGSPFADLAIAWNLNWLAIMLYGDAFVSPSGTGLTYTATTARLVQGMRENGSFPRIFGRVHPVSGIPQPAMWLNLAVSFFFLLGFRSWESLAEVFSVAQVISYVIGPVAAMVLRRTRPEVPRPVRTPLLWLVAPAGFVFTSLLFYWSRWPLTGEVMVLIALGVPIYLYYAWRARFAGYAPHLRAGLWLVGYLVFMVVVSTLGSRQFGGSGVIPYGADMAIVAVVALVFYVWGVLSGWAEPSREVAREAVALAAAPDRPEVAGGTHTPAAR